MAERSAAGRGRACRSARLGAPSATLPPLSAGERERSLQGVLTARGTSGPLRLFAYGALMWWSGISGIPSAPAVLSGYRRSMCVWTVEARGSPQNPGLGLGLDALAGASCNGQCLTFGRPEAGQRLLLERIWEREMWTGIYRPEWVELKVGDAGVRAVAFVANPNHPQFAAGLDLATQACLIRSARGKFGPCIDYLAQTVAALEAQGCPDQALTDLLAAAAGGAD